MRSLPAQVGLTGGRLALAALVAAALTAALALSGLWPPRAVETAVPAPQPALAVPFDGILAGAPLQRATCTNWQAASVGERRGAVAALAMLVGGASTGGGVGTTLTEAQGLALFDRQCATPKTRHFILYVMYARAAAFSRQ
jgi:hypothetical protein